MTGWIGLSPSAQTTIDDDDDDSLENIKEDNNSDHNHSFTYSEMPGPQQTMSLFLYT